MLRPDIVFQVLAAMYGVYVAFLMKYGSEMQRRSRITSLVRIGRI